MPTVKKPQKTPGLPVLKKPPILRGKPGYWVVIDMDSGKVVPPSKKTLAKAVRLAKKMGIERPSYDIVPPDDIMILPATALLGVY